LICYNISTLLDLEIVEMIIIWENGQVLAGADDLIQLIGRKVIVGKKITT
jgi:hypothetical protein